YTSWMVGGEPWAISLSVSRLLGTSGPVRANVVDRDQHHVPQAVPGRSAQHRAELGRARRQQANRLVHIAPPLASSHLASSAWRPWLVAEARHSVRGASPRTPTFGCSHRSGLLVGLCGVGRYPRIRVIPSRGNESPGWRRRV